MCLSYPFLGLRAMCRGFSPSITVPSPSESPSSSILVKLITFCFSEDQKRVWVYGSKAMSKSRASQSYTVVVVRVTYNVQIQSILVISNSKGHSEILRDIRTSTYQICRIEEKIIRATTFNKYMCNWTLEVRDLVKILWKRGEIALRSNFSSFPQHFLPVVRFSCLGRDQIRDKRGRDNENQLYIYIYRHI